MWETTRSTLLDIGGATLDVLIAIAKVVVIFWIASWVAKLARRWVVTEFSRRAFARNSAVLMGRLASIAIVFIALLIVLRMLGANWTALLAFAGAGTVAISLSLQDVLKNFFAGIYLLFERPFRVGDSIKIRDVEGTIQGIDIRTTLVKNLRGELVLVPNATVFTEILTNRSRYGTRRIDVTITKVTIEPETVYARLKDAFAGMQCVRQPLEWPKVTLMEPDGMTLVWSAFIDGPCDDPAAIANALNGALPDATIEFAAS
jgi:small-conductance mechanosensitive channel